MVEIRWEQRLRSAGERITPQRRLIASILQEQGGHLSADETSISSSQSGHRLSHAAMVKRAGLVQELRLNGDRHHYEIEREEAHQHMVCLECGRVIEFTCEHCADVHSDLAA